MARENTQARHEKRFGKPERLADLARVSPWHPPARGLYLESGVNDEGHAEWECSVGVLADEISACPVFSCDNVAEYIFSNPKEDFSWADLPALSIPFDMCWLECRRPFVNRFEERLAEGEYPDAWGSLCRKLEPSNVPEWLIERQGVTRDEFACVLHMEVISFRKGVFVGPLAYAAVCIDGGGSIVGQPGLGMRWSEYYEHQDRLLGMTGYCYQLIYPSLLSLAFLGCKNVSVGDVDPDRRLNRIRREAGLKPFVRYRTINIEPMKKVLRTEGGIETNGLRKALHICRGHFSTYSEDRPLFGRVAGTFWVPAHVRGSIKEGVVFSDYKVSPSRQPQGV